MGRKFISGKKDWVKEVISGWFPSINKIKHPEGVEKKRVIDREHYKKKNSYQERIKDIKTDIITKNVKETLENHN